MLSRRQFLGVGGAVLATAAGVPLYAWQVEPHWVEIVRRPMPLEHLPPALEGRTLLQISDMHVGPSVSSAYLIDALERARELAPDFVVFTGDFVTYRRSAEFDELARVLRHMPNGRRLQIAGLADVWSPEFGMYGEITPMPPMVPNGARSPEDGPAVEREAHAAVRVIEPRRPTVILSHNPDVQDLPIWDGVRGWVLAGHTHGGQVKPPFLPPPVLPVKNKRYTSGEFSVGPGRTLYINRGLGYLVQVRFNVRPELTLFTLQRAATPPS